MSVDAVKRMVKVGEMEAEAETVGVGVSWSRWAWIQWGTRVGELEQGKGRSDRNCF